MQRQVSPVGKVNCIPVSTAERCQQCSDKCHLQARSTAYQCQLTDRCQLQKSANNAEIKCHLQIRSTDYHCQLMTAFNYRQVSTTQRHDQLRDSVSCQQQSTAIKFQPHRDRLHLYISVNSNHMLAVGIYLIALVILVTQISTTDWTPSILIQSGCVIISSIILSALQQLASYTSIVSSIQLMMYINH